jgi:hypothetical protein
LTINPDGSSEKVEVRTTSILGDAQATEIHAEVDGEARKFDIGGIEYHLSDEALESLSESLLTKLIAWVAK